MASSGDDGTVRSWDTKSGRVVMFFASFDDGSAATLDPTGNRFLWASPGAWRRLAWRVFDPKSNRTRILPAEFKDPLPG